MKAKQTEVCFIFPERFQWEVHITSNNMGAEPHLTLTLPSRSLITTHADVSSWGSCGSPCTCSLGAAADTAIHIESTARSTRREEAHCSRLLPAEPAWGHSSQDVKLQRADSPGAAHPAREAAEVPGWGQSPGRGVGRLALRRTSSPQFVSTPRWAGRARCPFLPY